MSDLTKQSELKELALKIDALRKRRDDMLRSNNWIQNNQDEYILELDTQWPTISNALRSSASAGVREALESAERKLSAYVGVCKGDKELTEVVLPMLRSALSDHGVQNSAAGANTKSDGGVESRHAETGNKSGAAPEAEQSSSATSFVRASGPEDKTSKPRAGVTPGPSDPSPGPDVREALEECKHWHEREDKALSKSGRGDGDYYYRRNQHQEEIARIDAALQSVEGGVQGSSADGQQCNEQSGQSLSPAFGIIDPDYARIFTIARCLAWAEGYAIAMHGSFTRDLDLIAVPWAPHACEPEHLARRIESAAGLKISAHPKNDKPFGRLVWTFTLPDFGDPRFVDLSIIPRPSLEQDGQAELLEEEQRMIDLAWETHKAARPIDASTLAEEIRIQMNVRKTCVVSGAESLAKGLIEAFTITQLTKTPSAGHDDGNLRSLADQGSIADGQQCNERSARQLSPAAVELGKLLSASRKVHEWLSNWDLPFQDDDEWAPDLVAFRDAMNDATFEYVRAIKAVAETNAAASVNTSLVSGASSEQTSPAIEGSSLSQDGGASS